MLHQLDDRKNDRMADLVTFPLKFKPLFTLNLVNRLLVPAELFVFFAWLGLVSLQFHLLWLWFAIFIVFTYTKFSGWRLWTIPYRQLKFKFLYFLNDFYEQWLPVIFVLYLVSSAWEMVFILALHLVLFFDLIVRFTKDLNIIWTNLFLSQR